MCECTILMEARHYQWSVWLLLTFNAAFFSPSVQSCSFISRHDDCSFLPKICSCFQPNSWNMQIRHTHSSPADNHVTAFNSSSSSVADYKMWIKQRQRFNCFCSHWHMNGIWDRLMEVEAFKQPIRRLLSHWYTDLCKGTILNLFGGRYDYGAACLVALLCLVLGLKFIQWSLIIAIRWWMHLIKG